MTWIFLIFLFVPALATAQDCGDEKITVCREMAELPERFPLNSEEFSEACGSLIPMITCIKNVTVSCMDEENDALEEEVSHLTRLLVGLQFICDTDNPINKVLGDNLACYKTTIDASSDTCREVGELMSEAIGMEEDMEDLTICFEKVSEMICSLDHVEDECGDEAQMALAEAIKSFKLLEDYCPKEKAEEIFEGVMIILLGDEVKSELKDTVYSFV